MKLYFAAAFLLPLSEAFHTPGHFSVSSTKIHKTKLFASSDPFEFPSYEKAANIGKVTLTKPSTFEPNPNARKTLLPGQEPEVYEYDVTPFLKKKEKAEEISLGTKIGSIKGDFASKSKSATESFTSVTSSIPKPNISSLNVDTAGISKNLGDLKGKVTLNVLPPPSSVSLPASLSTDVLTQGGAAISLAAAALVTVRTTKVQREKAEAKKKAEAEAKAKAEALANRIDTKVIEASKSAFGSTSEIVKTKITPVVEKTSKDTAEKLGKALNTEIDPDTLAKATFALGGGVAAITLISSGGNSGTEVKKEEKVKPKPVAKTPPTKSPVVAKKQDAMKVEEVVPPKQVAPVAKKEEATPVVNAKPAVEEKKIEIAAKPASSPTISTETVTSLPSQTNINLDVEAMTKNPLVIAPFAILSIRAALVNNKAKRELEQIEQENKEFYDNLKEKVEKAKKAAKEIENDV